MLSPERIALRVFLRIVLSIVCVAALIVDSGSALARRRCARRKPAPRAEAAAPREIRLDPILYLPEYVEVVASVPGEFFSWDSNSAATSPLGKVVIHTAGMALATVDLLDEKTLAAVEINGSSESALANEVAPLGRLIVGVWQRPLPADEESITRAAPPDWDGVALFIMNDGRCLAESARAAGFVPADGENRALLVADVVHDDGNRRVKYAAIVSDRILAVGSTAEAVKHIVAAAAEETRELADPWDAYRSREQSAKFWVARRSGVRIWGVRNDAGFSAVPSFDGTKIDLTYHFDKGKVPPRYRVGAVVDDYAQHLLSIADYGTVVTVKGISDSRLMVQMPLIGESQNASAVWTIISNLGTLPRWDDPKGF